LLRWRRITMIPSQNLGTGTAQLGALTKREQQVAALIGHALANKEIAHRLGVTEGTVKHHAHMIFKKLGVKSRAALIHRLIA
jgi:DNA-binding NarL/FixJ family response regulator